MTFDRAVSLRSTRLLMSASIIAAAVAMPATADADPPDDVSGVLVVGPIADSGEASSLDGGLGKLRSGGDEIAITADAILAWSPQLSDHLRAVITAEVFSDAQPAGGLGEAYLKYRADPGGTWRVSGRAGLFFPPVSLEHDGTEWSVTHTLTPSAINTWIAEEVKTTGLELTLRGAIGAAPVGVTLAAFTDNDTSGALLAFRGWALHDVRATLGGTFDLPDVPAMFAGKQAGRTRPVDEVDGDVGGYGQLEWSPASDVKLSAFAYDNNGDETSLRNGQYAWRTRFVQVALDWSVADDIEILAQAMSGDTRMGALSNGLSPAHVDFIAAYGLVTRDLQKGAIAFRLDYFAVSDQSFKAFDNNAENGWSASLNWVRPVHERTELVMEGILAVSDRPDRLRFGLDRYQTSGQARVVLRTVF